MKGLWIAHRCSDVGVPRFLTRAQRVSFSTLAENRRHVFFFNTRRPAFAHLIQMRTAAGARLEVTPAGRCVWAVVAGEGLALGRIRRLLKWVRDQADFSWTLAELVADAGAPATAIKASPMARQIATRDVDGTPLTFTTALHHTVMGFDHKAWANDTTAAELDAVQPAPWEGGRQRALEAALEPQAAPRLRSKPR